MKQYKNGAYMSCIHSYQKKSAPWKVYASCCGPSRQPTYRGYLIPSASDCLNCPCYQEDIRKGGSHRG